MVADPLNLKIAPNFGSSNLDSLPASKIKSSFRLKLGFTFFIASEAEFFRQNLPGFFEKKSLNFAELILLSHHLEAFKIVLRCQRSHRHGVCIVNVYVAEVT